MLIDDSIRAERGEQLDLDRLGNEAKECGCDSGEDGECAIEGDVLKAVLVDGQLGGEELLLEAILDEQLDFGGVEIVKLEGPCDAQEVGGRERVLGAEVEGVGEHLVVETVAGLDQRVAH